MNPADGRQIYQERLGPGGQYCASPVAADGRIYFVSVPGVVTVIDAAADRLQVLATNELGENVQASPAIVGNRLYVRTAGHLLAFGEAR